MKDNFYRVAELDMLIQFAESATNDERLIESFEPFRVSAPKGSILFHLTVDDSTRPYPKEKRERIRNFDTGSGHTLVDKLDNGGLSSATSMMPTVHWSLPTPTSANATVRLTAA